MIALAVVGTGWSGAQALTASTALTRAAAAAADVRLALSKGDLGAAEHAAVSFERHAADARAATDGPLFRLAGAVPVAGRTPLAVSRMAEAADVLGRDVLPPLLSTARQMADARGGAPLDARALHDAQPVVRAAAAAFDDARRLVHEVPDRGVPAAVRSARRTADQGLSGAAEAVHAAAAVTEVAPGMLGVDGRRRYLLALQNSAEARGSGGLLGLFGVLEAEAGTIRLVSLDGNHALPVPPGAPVPTGADFAERFGRYGSGESWFNANMTEHFPDTATVWTGLWHSATGERLDGVLAVDPSVLEDLLTVTGPVQLRSGRTLAAADAVELTQETSYVTSSDARQRKAELAQLVRAVADSALSGRAPASALAGAFATAASERRLLIASSHPDEQAVLERTSAGGAVPDTKGPFVMLTVNNAGGNKLDYYLDRAVDYHAGPCRAGVRPSRVTIRLHNGAPLGLPDYVTGRLDARRSALPYGHHRLLVSVLTTTGARLRSASVDGEPALVEAFEQRGRPVFDVPVDLPRGQDRTLVLELEEPARAGTAVVLTQPLVRPAAVSARTSSCGSAPHA